MQERVIQIKFIDRLGLGYQIFEQFEKNQIDKVSMEVSPGDGMMIKFRYASERQVEGLLGDLETVPGIISAGFREQMPSEDREHELTTILNSVSEGIMAIDREGKITHLNKVAGEIFHISGEKAIGLKAEEVLASDPPILETLKTGQSYGLIEKEIHRNGRTIHFLTSGVPVRNEKGQVIGAVATIKDFRQMEEIISKIEQGQHRPFEEIVFQSARMNQLVNMARTIAKGSSTILLRGESGTGKELFATAIHKGGPRGKAPFIAVNCAALPESLLESELFGYEEGTFTGALKGGRKGLFEQGDGGTLFLDEVGEISPRVQVKLLRVLQDGAIRRVGGSKEFPVDVRVIAATHRNLEEMIRKGGFREDLYYRLNVIPLQIPPLRERREDIPLIARQLIRKISAKLHKPEPRLNRESVDLLTRQPWPGNVRQLDNTLERLLNLVDEPEITARHLLEWTDVSLPEEVAGNSGGTSGGSAVKTAEAGGYPGSEPRRRPDSQAAEDFLHIKVPKRSEWPPLKEIVAEVEKQVLTRVLERYPSSRLAGQVLGVSNTTILNKMKEYKIH